MTLVSFHCSYRSGVEQIGTEAKLLICSTKTFNLLIYFSYFWLLCLPLDPRLACSDSSKGSKNL
jgi:hypothetical protein